LPFVTNMRAIPVAGSGPTTFAVSFNLALPHSAQLQGLGLGSDYVQWLISLADPSQGTLSEVTNTEHSAISFSLSEAMILVQGITLTPAQSSSTIVLTVPATDLDTGRQYQIFNTVPQLRDHTMSLSDRKFKRAVVFWVCASILGATPAGFLMNGRHGSAGEWAPWLFLAACLGGVQGFLVLIILFRMSRSRRVALIHSRALRIAGLSLIAVTLGAIFPLQ
jgi:hypothetical protein